MSTEIHLATEDRFHNVAAILAPRKPTTPACWCLTYRLTNAENGKLRGEARPDRLREYCRGEPPPGVIAYVDGDPAGWCSFGPRSSFHRLVKSRTIPRVDDRPVWSVICFIVRAPYRRRGLSRGAAGCSHRLRRHERRPHPGGVPHRLECGSRQLVLRLRRDHVPVRERGLQTHCSYHRAQWRRRTLADAIVHTAIPSVTPCTRSVRSVGGRSACGAEPVGAER